MDKRAKKLGYANAEEMREKYKNNEVSPWLLGVYTGNFVPPGKPKLAHLHILETFKGIRVLFFEIIYLGSEFRNPKVAVFKENSFSFLIF